jgi:hypothetical protein
MVYFGIAPSIDFLEKSVGYLAEKVKKPIYQYPDIPFGMRVPYYKDIKKLKPANEYFVYRVQLNGNL